jgi:hypothetical protein
MTGGIRCFFAPDTALFILKLLTTFYIDLSWESKKSVTAENAPADFPSSWL